MPVERSLGIREPRLRLGFALCAALALAAGLGLQVGVRYMLSDLQWLPSDVAALRAASWLTGLAMFVGGVCLISGAVFFHAFHRSIAEQRMPPSGPWSLGAARVVTGKPAVLLGRVGMGLALALGLSGLALGSYSLWFVRSVVACAAKNL